MTAGAPQSAESAALMTSVSWLPSRSQQPTLRLAAEIPEAATIPEAAALTAVQAAALTAVQAAIQAAPLTLVAASTSSM